MVPLTEWKSFLSRASVYAKGPWRWARITACLLWPGLRFLCDWDRMSWIGGIPEKMNCRLWKSCHVCMWTKTLNCLFTIPECEETLYWVAWWIEDNGIQIFVDATLRLYWSCGEYVFHSSGRVFKDRYKRQICCWCCIKRHKRCCCGVLWVFIFKFFPFS